MYAKFYWYTFTVYTDSWYKLSWTSTWGYCDDFVKIVLTKNGKNAFALHMIHVYEHVPEGDSNFFFSLSLLNKNLSCEKYHIYFDG
jgi:hypothetical protein